MKRAAFPRDARRSRRAGGFTLVELLLAVALIAMLTGAVGGAVRGVLRGFDEQRSESSRLRSASGAVARISRFGAGATAVTYPASGATSRDSLVLVAGIDEDRDGRVNEDDPGDVSGDGRPGAKNVDDDGDGKIDEDAAGRAYGTIGWGTWLLAVGATAIPNDDDEDGVQDEDRINRVAWTFQKGTLTEEIDGVSEILATGITGFEATSLPASKGARRMVRIRIWYGASAADSTAYFERLILPSNDLSRFGVRTDG